jgi:hypothetical protein
LDEEAAASNYQASTLTGNRFAAPAYYDREL